jgi:hypothetical protein
MWQRRERNRGSFCFVFVCCRIQTVKFERLDGLGILKSEENSIGYGNRAS